MRVFLIFLIIMFVPYIGNSQTSENEVIESIKKNREDQHKEFLDKEESPLEAKDIKKFTGLDYFPIDLKYRVKVNYIEHDFKKFFTIETTTDRRPEYVRFAQLNFTIDGTEYSLQAYQNQDLTDDREYDDYLFIPFNDDTNGMESYGGGRYLDFRIPEGNEVYLDFNLSYNPLCAYNPKYSCPIPPQENYLTVRIPAGVKDYKKGKKK